MTHNTDFTILVLCVFVQSFH